MTLHAHQTYVIEEFTDEYHAHRLQRRELLRRVLMITGSVPLTATTLFALGCSDSDDEAEGPLATRPPAPTATLAAGTPPGVAETDAAIEARDVTFPGPASEMKAYLARPKGNGPFPAVLVVHENAGLLPHFKDVARRFAKEGFVGLAIDLVSRLGGTSADAAKNMQALRASADDFVADMQAGLNYLKAQSFVKATAMGVTGFCFGGGMAFELTAKSMDIKAAVPFYGSPSADSLELLTKTRAAVLFFNGSTDTRLVGNAPNIEAKLKQSGSPVESKIYEGAGHAFFNEDKPSYNKDAAIDAWPRTLAWFRKYLT